jgi:hypothetical protein
LQTQISLSPWGAVGPRVGVAHVNWSPALVFRMRIRLTRSGGGPLSLHSGTVRRA